MAFATVSEQSGGTIARPLKSRTRTFDWNGALKGDLTSQSVAIAFPSDFKEECAERFGTLLFLVIDRRRPPDGVESFELVGALDPAGHHQLPQ